MGEAKRRREAEKAAQNGHAEEPQLAPTERPMIEHVPPGITPTTYDFIPVPREDGDTLVMVRFFTPSGMDIYFFEPGKLKLLADMAFEAAKRAESGIEKIAVPDKRIIIPGQG